MCVYAYSDACMYNADILVQCRRIHVHQCVHECKRRHIKHKNAHVHVHAGTQQIHTFHLVCLCSQPKRCQERIQAGKGLKNITRSWMCVHACMRTRLRSYAHMKTHAQVWFKARALRCLYIRIHDRYMHVVACMYSLIHSVSCLHHLQEFYHVTHVHVSAYVCMHVCMYVCR